MTKFINKIIKIFFKKEFLIFVIIGTINAFNGIIFALIYSKLFQPNVAFVFGYATSLIISYILNSYFTFKEKLNFKKFIKFCISYIPNFIVQFLSVLVIYNILNYDKLIAYILAAIIGIPITFLLLKFYTFSKKEK